MALYYKTFFMRVTYFEVQVKKALRSTQERIAESGVLDDPKDNSGSSSSSLSGSDDEVQDVSSDKKNKADENKADAEVAEKQARDEQPV
ncbi:hypothetical protein Tco_0282656 [Tanacetum coccineum]